MKVSVDVCLNNKNDCFVCDECLFTQLNVCVSPKNVCIAFFVR